MSSVLRQYSNTAFETMLGARRSHTATRNKSSPAGWERRADASSMLPRGRIFRQGEQTGSVELRRGDIFQLDAALPSAPHMPLENRAQKTLVGDASATHASVRLGTTPSTAAQVSSRKICRCGTAVLFPGALATRTCWNCNAVIHRDEARSTPSAQPVHFFIGEESQTGGEEAASSTLRAPLRLEQATNGKEIPAVHGCESQVTAPALPCGLQMWALLGLLVLSIALNAAGMMVHVNGSTSSLPVPFIAHELDTDGDGVLDHHDFCPFRCTVSNTTCSDAGWRSGPATDFDGDGCQDGVEDLDKDGDGVWDVKDRCPFTAQMYKFISNPLVDFDADGCLDGLEDTDDDGDDISNTFDVCPQTQLGAIADATGCSEFQMQHQPKEPMPLPPSFVHIVALQSERKDRPQSVMDQWMPVIKSAWVEVILGALLTELLQELMREVHWFQSEVTSPTSSILRRGFWKKAGLRTLLYTTFFFLVYCVRLLGQKS